MRLALCMAALLAVASGFLPVGAVRGTLSDVFARG